ncbi:MAG: diguanylate cyclase [Thermoanaerobaculales bacterium]
MKLVTSFLLPAALLLVAALAAFQPQFFPDSLPAFLRFFPGIVFALGVVLGVLFRRGRVVAALAALAVAYEVLHRFAPTGGVDGASRFALDAIGVLLPVNLAIIAVLRERGAFSATGVTWVAAIAVQPALMAFAWISYHPALVAALRHVWWPGLTASGLAVAQPALLAFVLALGATVMTWMWRRTPVEIGLAWALVAAFLALQSAALARAASLFLATGGVILVTALIEGAFALAYRDGLTRLPSRRALDDALAELRGVYTLAMADIDHFKQVNDTYGHDVGDQVLRMVASKLAAIPGGRAFRYGGEEFAIVFTGKPCSQTRPLLETLREEVAAASFTLRGEDRPKRKPKEPRRPARQPGQIAVTISIGAAEGGSLPSRAEAVLKTADEALYRAKQAGRNRVVA